MMRAVHSQHGFTMVELIVGMVISTILAGMIAMLIGAPVDSYMQQARDGELVEASDRITRTLTADLGRALPNSVRIRNVGTRSILQMLDVTDVVYFVPEPVGATPAQQEQGLRFGATDTQFTAYGSFLHSSATPFLVVNNEGQGGFDAYSMDGVIVQNAVPGGTNTNVNVIDISPAFEFTHGAPTTNRMFVVDAPITYVCNRATGVLQRFAKHVIGANLPANESAPQLNSVGTEVTVVATGVTACSFACAAGSTAPCLSTLTLTMNLSRGVAPDVSTTRVLHQVAVENTP
jgi:MSHA biogenesis protein MshO